MDLPWHRRGHLFVREHMKVKKLSNAKLALQLEKVTGQSPIYRETVNRWINHQERINLSIWQWLADALEVAPEALLSPPLSPPRPNRPQPGRGGQRIAGQARLGRTCDDRNPKTVATYVQQLNKKPQQPFDIVGELVALDVVVPPLLVADPVVVVPPVGCDLPTR